MRRLAVIGAGWAGLTAAVRGVQAGWQVTLLEIAPRAGGRARSTPAPEGLRDNGQHILIGAYRRTQGLMSELGVPLQEALLRLPLTLQDARGHGLRLPDTALALALPWAVLRARGWRWSERASLVRHALRWARDSFECDPAWTVDRLTAQMPAPLRRGLIDPLCVAALNTPSREASAAVFLRVLRDALLSGPGSADMLLPRLPLDALLPAPALRWLQQRGAAVHMGRRLTTLAREGAGWQADGEAYDAMVLACSSIEAARLVQPHAPDWAMLARQLQFEPIVTVQLLAPGARLGRSVVALDEGPSAPAQFLFDQGQISSTPGLFSAVISGAAAWVEAGRDATAAAVQAQLRAQLPSGLDGARWPDQPEVVSVQAERRATFRCLPALQRPPALIRPGLVAAGDYVAGPYPATLEGAVMAGEAAIAALLSHS